MLAECTSSSALALPICASWSFVLHLDRTLAFDYIHVWFNKSNAGLDPLLKSAAVASRRRSWRHTIDTSAFWRTIWTARQQSL
jgi:hypothetical protein